MDRTKRYGKDVFRGSKLFDGAGPEAWRPRPLPSLRGAKVVYADCESTGLRWWGKDRPIGWAYSVDGGPEGYAPFGHEGGGNLDEPAVKAWALSEDGFAGKKIIGLHIKFDAHNFRKWAGKSLDEIGCTLGDVGHYAAILDDWRRTFSLESISQDYLDEGKVDLDMSRGAHVYHASQVEAYATQDVSLVRRIHAKQVPLLAAQGLEAVAALEDACMPATLEMEWNAVPLDLELLERWCLRSEQQYYKLLFDIREQVGFTANPNSVKDLARIFRLQGFEPVVLPDPKTQEPRVTYSDEALATLAGNKVIDLLRRAKRLDSIRSKYLLKYRETALRTDGLLRYQLNQLKADEGGTVSGRFSSSAYKLGDDEEGANVQQAFAVKKQRVAWGYDEDDASHDDEIYVVRKLYRAAPGQKYWAADAEQIEYRVFADVSADKLLLDAYRENPRVNFHKHVAKLVPNLPYKAVKNVNFCKLFGGGEEKIAYMIGCSVAQAREFIREYDKKNPSVSRMLSQAARLAASRGYVKTLTGRRARFPDKQRLHSALNRIIQGTAADINKQKLVELHRERKRLNLTMRLTVHDEVCGDVPDTESARACEELLNVQSFPLKVPILWAGGIGDCWADCA